MCYEIYYVTIHGNNNNSYKFHVFGNFFFIVSRLKFADSRPIFVARILIASTSYFSLFLLNL